MSGHCAVDGTGKSTTLMPEASTQRCHPYLMAVGLLTEQRTNSYWVVLFQPNIHVPGKGVLAEGLFVTPRATGPKQEPRAEPL